MRTIEEYGLPAAQRFRRIDKLMPEGGQAAPDRLIDACLDLDSALLREEPREIERLLHVQAIDIAVEHDADMTHGLERPAHDAEGHIDQAPPPHHRRDDRMKRPLAGPYAIGMAGRRHEIGAAIL